ncbi:biopolymer transporter ExbD [Frateuria sp. Soil773]|uniref:ExbD/TolR family protein n=1 Tax=Frateuria sp. Soil773 TaxID=1736407 RepID=UPI0006F8CA98|nr:biopolymer transporter ExbD [Frateuria sp. Soil773]KRE89420.1 biopolymer transporter ExbD [Frateuria sp. Soil773]
MAFSARTSGDAIAHINVTPLVDVLLVLLVIFMITAPVLTHKLKIDLPQSSSGTPPPSIEPIRLAIRADGAMSWNGTPVDEPALQAQLAVVASRGNPPELAIAAADGVPYQAVARVLAQARSQGLTRIGFADGR